MVGVPGRSKACITCRKRRKGCDSIRPRCTQCLRAGLPCEGYIRQRLFINKTTTTITTTSTQNNTVKPSPLEAVSGSVLLPAALSHSAYEDKYIGLYWDTYLPSRQLLSRCKDSDRICLGGWTTTVQDLYVTSPVLRKALLALCLSTISRRDGQQWMAEEGLKFYVSALQGMSGALKVPANAKNDALLLANKLFSLYEAMYGGDGQERFRQARSWLAHCGGDMALLISRRPEEYISGYAHRLFVDGRMALVNNYPLESYLASSSLLTRKKSILSHDEWKTIPWSLQPKTPKDQLTDILVDIPSLLEDFDIMDSCIYPEKKEAQRQVLFDTCWALINQLTEWHNNHSSLLSSKLPDPGTTEYITTSDLVTTHLLTQYWTLCLIISKTLLELAPPPHQPSHLKSPHFPPPTNRHPATYARLIIHAVHIFLHPSVGTFRWHLVSFPVSWVVRYMNSDSVQGEEMRAEREMLEGLFRKKEAWTLRRWVLRERRE
ncbi:hypothetical protein BGZ60DRAFT_375305 [Tricladium varicosporioides]|nr:hypothetical protein BGZ60DRAFT_375305 [Hymenoscyphus varicosporioides]